MMGSHKKNGKRSKLQELTEEKIEKCEREMVQ